jgi:hypothetical protein
MIIAVPKKSYASRYYRVLTMVYNTQSYALIHLCTGRNLQTQRSLERALTQSRMTSIEITVAAERKQVHVKGKKYWIKGELKFISNTHILQKKNILQDSRNRKM